MWATLGHAFKDKQQISFKCIKTVITTMLIPTLLSGLSPLCLPKKEINHLDERMKSIWRRIFSLSENSTVIILVWITGVPLPSTTLILNILSLFWNVWQHNSPVKEICINILKNKTKGYYWINVVQDICRKYSMPSPLYLLQSPLMDKNTWKNYCKNKVHTEENNYLMMQVCQNNYFKYVHPLDFSINRKNIHPLLDFPESPDDMVRMKANIRFLINEILFKKDIEKSSTCTLCNDDRVQSVCHIISECKFVLADKSIMQTWGKIVSILPCITNVSISVFTLLFQNSEKNTVFSESL